MSRLIAEHLDVELSRLARDGLLRAEREIVGTQDSRVHVTGDTFPEPEAVLNFCSNNYLGLSNHPHILRAARDALAMHGFGMSSVRFICGTHHVHKRLENALSIFLGMEDTILYSSCFDANAGLFETLLGERDAIISDALNHASIIDGIRLSKARCFRYANNNLGDLEACLKRAADARFRLIVTDGVFSMDGQVADLPAICDLAERYDALVAVDDSHAVGFVGESGRGTHERHGVMDRIDIVTGTLGKALGGASGGYVSGRREIIAWLRQTSRPYLFSNALMPCIAAAGLEALDIVAREPCRCKRLWQNTRRLRDELGRAGFEIAGGHHPILPVMIRDPRRTRMFADALLERGVYTVPFSYPVVPANQDRIRLQASAAHSDEHISMAVEAFVDAGRQVGII